AAKIGEGRFGDLFARACDLFLLVLDVLFGTHTGEVGRPFGSDRHKEFALIDLCTIDRVEELKDISVRKLRVLAALFKDVVRHGLHIYLRREPKAQRTQKDGGDDLTLT